MMMKGSLASTANSRSSLGNDFTHKYLVSLRIKIIIIYIRLLMLFHTT